MLGLKVLAELMLRGVRYGEARAHALLNISGSLYFRLSAHNKALLRHY